MPRRPLSLVLLIASGLLFVASMVQAADEPTYDPKLFKSMKYRLVGPFRGGRSTAVSGVAGQRDVFYMGTTGGGVWKTSDGGGGWVNVSDESFEAGSIGAIAVADADPNVVYAGTGSACVRGNISPGVGVYRSTDAGDTWKHVGLDDAGQIGRIRVHPRNPDLVYVAALGHIFGSNEERGVFRSADGGATWQHVLKVSDRAGAVDLSMDPTNPRILYAAFWQVERKPWTLTSGGEDSGLWKSADGGDTWEKLTKGLPDGIQGRIGVSASGAKAGRVYALIEAEDGGIFRSDDHGKTFELINPDRNFRQRAWYYTHIHADPVDPETVYVMNVGFWRSHDGGEDFEFVRVPHGDNHDLWISPVDNQILINANDGGSNVSYNGGKSWSTQTNQPTAEFYRVTVDDQFPYRLYGGQQDNSTVSIASRTTSSAIGREHWFAVAGCECAHIAVDPRNPDVTYGGCYGGSISRHDHATGQNREVVAYPQLAVGQAAEDLRYRFQWNAPIRISPHDPSVLYHCSQYVHRSTDEGQSWEVISPDLSRNDAGKQALAGGPITYDNTGVEVYGTVFAFEPSPLDPDLLWAGSDDGLVHVSRDDGKTWRNVTPRQMPEWAQVNSIDPSRHDPGRAFLAVTRYRLDDLAPYVFRTDDHGRTWRSLTDGGNGIPDDHFVRVVREDPDREGLLYAGTEFGIYVSFDDGKRWQSLQLELPATPITDLAVHRGDLVVATQGRSFWILDDLSPLHQMSAAVAEADVFLFEPRAAYRMGGGISFGGGGPAGSNPPNGVMIHYTLASPLEDDDELVLEILDASGHVLRSLSSKRPEPRAYTPWSEFLPALAKPVKLEAEEGLNRFVWDLRLPDATIEDKAILWGVARGPRVPPGTYSVRLTHGEWTETHSFDVLKDPRLATSQSDFDAQYELSRKIWNALTETHETLARIRDVRTQVNDLVARLGRAGLGDDLDEPAGRLVDRLTKIEEALHQTRSESSQDILNYTPRLDNQFLALHGDLERADARPTDGTRERFADLRAELDGHLDELRETLDTELVDFNDLVRSKTTAPVIVPD